jgi:outer membrane protein assembly factor BamB
MIIKKIFICCFGLILVSQLHAQADSLPKPIEDIFEVVWSDTINLINFPNGITAPLINGNLVIPPYGNDGCYLAETGQKLYYTFSPHQKIIRDNMSSKYVLFKTDYFSKILDITTGKEVYDGFYKKAKDYYRTPLVPENRVINSRYVCFASGPKTFTCVDTSTMKEKWVFESDYELYDSYIEHEQVVYVGSEKYIYAIDIQTGALKWKTEVGIVKANLILEDNILYASIEAKGIVALEIGNGDIKFTTKRISLFLNPRKLLNIDNSLYFIDHKIFAVNKENGEYIFETDNYESCTNTQSFFIYKDYIFAQSCARNNYFLEGFNKYTGKKVYKVSKEIEGNQAEDFLINATYFSEPYKDMIYATSMAFIENRFWVAKIYGVKIKVGGM